MNKNRLDEIPAQRKNNIGNQSFLLLMYLLGKTLNDTLEEDNINE
jgi:hypothetical protein